MSASLNTMSSHDDAAKAKAISKQTKSLIIEPLVDAAGIPQKEQFPRRPLYRLNPIDCRAKWVSILRQAA
jgi:hypothetical protein